MSIKLDCESFVIICYWLKKSTKYYFGEINSVGNCEVTIALLRKNIHMLFSWSDNIDFDIVSVRNITKSKNPVLSQRGNLDFSSSQNIPENIKKF